jgi:prolyl-tRNA editing enzyme YbaK/EbsC (Cys-tRNA(Pro) deacylase)
MHPNVERFRAAAREILDRDLDVRELPEGTHSAADAAAAIGCPQSAIVKSLLFVCAGEPVLVYAAGMHEVDEDALAAHLGCDSVELADPETVKQETGWAIGGVPPVGHEVARCLLDPALTDFETIWGGAGTPEAVAAVDPAELIELVGAEPAAVFD